MKISHRNSLRYILILLAARFGFLINIFPFIQHFIFIADAMTFQEGDHESSLWSESDGMYYDAISFGPGRSVQLPVRSLVGLIPLYGTLVLEPEVLKRFPGFKKRMEWFINNRPEVSARNMANMKGVFCARCSRRPFLTPSFI